MSTNGLQTDESVALSDRLLYLVRVVPWWAVMLVFGILYLGYNMLNDPNKRDVLDFLADRPQVQTDDLFSVTYRVETDALLVRESFLITDFSGERPTILLDDVISREEGILPCPADAPEDCNDLRGTIISYRVYDIPDGVEPAGTFRVEGLVRGQLGDFSIVNLINGEQVTVSLAAIVSEREGIFPCDRVAEPTCTSATGQILTFDRPFIIQQGREVRHDVVIRHLEDGFEEAIRPVFVRETREGILECDEDDPQPCAEIPVFYVTILENVSGVEIQRTDVAVRIRTVERVAFEIPRDRVLGMEPGIVECDQAADPRCQDYPGTMVQLTAETLTGRLTNETDTHYYVLFEDTGSPIRYNRGDITDELRSPESCRALDQDPPVLLPLLYALVL